ncbi:MAG: acylphosphatase [Immundisolibacteraceae bacterium]|nr:acylphosphatase [Immundisolibacteraceae bacterium]
MDFEANHYLISGQVQRVYFRQSTLTEAEQLGLTGWVRNLPDGRVEAVAYGTAAALEQFDAWVRVGPKMATVDQVEQRAIEPTEPPVSFTLHSTPSE